MGLGRGVEHSSHRQGAQLAEEIKEYVADSQYYRDDLTEQGVLALIPRKLNIIPVEGEQWLSCR